MPNNVGPSDFKICLEANIGVNITIGFNWVVVWLLGLDFAFFYYFIALVFWDVIKIIIVFLD